MISSSSLMDYQIIQRFFNSSFQILLFSLNRLLLWYDLKKNILLQLIFWSQNNFYWFHCPCVLLLFHITFFPLFSLISLKIKLKGKKIRHTSCVQIEILLFYWNAPNFLSKFLYLVLLHLINFMNLIYIQMIESLKCWQDVVSTEQLHNRQNLLSYLDLVLKNQGWVAV